MYRSLVICSLLIVLCLTQGDIGGGEEKIGGGEEKELVDIYSESGHEDETDASETKLRRSHRTAPTDTPPEEIERENKNSHHPDRLNESPEEDKPDQSNDEIDQTGEIKEEDHRVASLQTKKRIYGLKTILLKYFILPIKKTLTFLFKEDADTHYVMKKNDGSKHDPDSKEEKVYSCPRTNVTTNNTVSYIIEDDLITNMNLSGGCGAVLFYSMYCPFSIQLMPHYRALTRVYPSLKLFAVEINAYSSSCLQFGAVGTPTVVLFLNSRPIKKIPTWSRNITSITQFIMNITDLKPEAPIEVVPEDREGVELKEQPDYVLLLSLMFLVTSAMYHLSRTRTGTSALDGVYNLFYKLKRD